MGNMKDDYAHILDLYYDAEYQETPISGASYINTQCRKIEKLDGEWAFSIDTYDTGIRKKFFEEVIKDENGKYIPVDFEFDSWLKVKLPSNWNFYKPEFLYYEGTAIFTRTFLYNQDSKEKVFIQFGAANYETKLWINGKYVGRHIGGYSPFSFEITNFLKEDMNRIYITVNNERKLESVPSKNFDWFNYGGIYRSIELIKVKESYIKNYHIYLKPDGEYNTIISKLFVENGITGHEAIMKIPELNIVEKILINSEIQEQGKEIFASNIELWDIDNPKLYDIEIEYNGEVLKDKIGFREIIQSENKIYLNGRSIYLKGISVHEEMHLKGRNLSDEEMIQVFKDAKELNCNYIRLAHYPHHENMAKIADELGMLLWEEIPVYWALDFDNPITIHSANSQLEGLIYRDINRAAVIIWSIGNENPDIDNRLNFMKNLSEKAKKIDPSRLIAAACLINIDSRKIEDRLIKYVDIVGINEYYGWYYTDFNVLQQVLENSKMINKPVIVSETGAGCVAGHHGQIGELFTEEHQQYVYENQFKLLDQYDYIRGISPWILYDFRTQVRVNRFQKGYNRKGLMCENRKQKKLGYYVVQNYYYNK